VLIKGDMGSQEGRTRVMKSAKFCGKGRSGDQKKSRVGQWPVQENNTTIMKIQRNTGSHKEKDPEILPMTWQTNKQGKPEGYSGTSAHIQEKT